MRSIVLSALFSLLALLALAHSTPAPLAMADEADGAPPADKAASAEATSTAGKWQTLFDGKTLKNWKSTQFGGEGEVLVEDGALVMDMGNPLTGATWTGKPLPKINYEVELEGRRMAGSDFFCALTFPVKDEHASLVLGGWGGTIIGISCINGYDASENETTDFYKFEKNKWYKIRLQVTDQAIKAWIDDQQVADVEHPQREMSVRIEVEASKPFGIATFQTKGAIRNVRLRSLKPKQASTPPSE